MAVDGLFLIVGIGLGAGRALWEAARVQMLRRGFAEASQRLR